MSPDQTTHFVIVGGGLAGAHAAEELRSQGFDGRVTLICGEPHAPYERPPLSKEVLQGAKEPDSVFVHDEGWYADHDIDLRLGERATAMDREQRTVTVGGEPVSYDKLLLATGSSPRPLAAFDESDLKVAYLRTIEDSLALKDALHGHVLFIGAGWIGLEVAAAARKAGADVTIVEMAPLPLVNVLGDELAGVFADLHREHGVDLRLGTSVDSISARTVSLSDGTSLRPDLVVVGIGAAPDTGLAESAGLDVDNGVLVDAQLRSSDPNVFAAGDLANHDHPSLGRLRVEHWDNAIEQGKHAARSMMGRGEAYDRQPYFFTDQYDLGMEYVGHASGNDEVVVHGSKADRVLTALWIRDDRVVAGMHLNDWDAIDPIKKVVGGPATDQLRDPASQPSDW